MVSVADPGGEDGADAGDDQQRHPVQPADTGAAAGRSAEQQR